ncbi:MAG TPA: ScyD/ScyE family protein [Chthoniobacterales bacterium]|nr:ScyD/ScyE family protein [Chthoniobacterales bacterium]
MKTKAALAIASLLVVLCAPARTLAQCPVTEVTTGLQAPLGIVLSKKGNLLIAETGNPNPNSGRISIVSSGGTRRTLIDGLPSGISSEGNEPSGPAGVFLHDRTLYVAIGVGDAVIAGPVQGSEQPNPNPSSPLLSSVLAIHFSTAVEKNTQGFSLTMSQQQTLASRQPVTLTNSANEQITVELVANFPNYTPDPRPDFAGNVRNSNPFDLVAAGNHLYVTDGGQNVVYDVNLTSGAFTGLVAFPPVANPLPFGPPFVDAVPTGIAFSDGQLLVTLFRGFPFAPGTSVVEKVNPQTGSHAPFISGLKTAIDVVQVHADEDLTNVSRYLVLEHSSGDVLSGPGRLLRFNQAGAAPVVLADCLAAPSSMALDPATGTLYLTELNGHVAAIAVAAEPRDLDAAFLPTLLNVATRGKVQSGDEVLIGGFILGAGTSSGNSRVVVRAIGPSLSSKGVLNPLPNPILELHDAIGAIIARNDDWKQTQQAEIEATGLAPANELESAILTTLPPGGYTAVVLGANNDTGIAVVEVYALN